MAKTINNNWLRSFSIILLISISSICYADSCNIGKIDLNKALVLHPKMFFFDYKRLGFYKEHLNIKENQLNSSKNELDKSREIKSIKNTIKELKRTSNFITKSKLVHNYFSFNFLLYHKSHRSNFLL